MKSAEFNDKCSKKVIMLKLIDIILKKKKRKFCLLNFPVSSCQAVGNAGLITVSIASTKQTNEFQFSHYFNMLAT
jgi:hypothetical protein